MLCCVIVYNTKLYYTILYYTILYYTILYYTILYYILLDFTIPCQRTPRLQLPESRQVPGAGVDQPLRMLEEGRRCRRPLEFRDLA